MEIKICRVGNRRWRIPVFLIIWLKASNFAKQGQILMKAQM